MSDQVLPDRLREIADAVDEGALRLPQLLAAQLAGSRDSSVEVLEAVLDGLVAPYVKRCLECGIWIPQVTELVAEGSPEDFHENFCSHSPDFKL